MAQKLETIDRKARALHPARGGADQHQHLVQFYDDDRFLVATVADFLEHSLTSGDAAIVVATAAHIEAIGAHLESQGIDLTSARRDGSFTALDAGHTLGVIMRDGAPDPALFAELSISLLDRAGRQGREVRVFGEMVAVLWDEGNVTAALQLEELWNDLAGSHRFELLCGYPMRSFRGPSEALRFDQVCGQHSRVIPAESYSALADPDERLRDVARLQQRAAAQTELTTALKQLEEMGRMRDEFVAMVVHDIRAPMAVIGGFMQLLRDNMSKLDEERTRDLLDRGLVNVQHVTSLVNDILTVSEIESGHFSFDVQEVDVVEIVYRAVSGVRDMAPQTRFAVSSQGSLVTGAADEARQLQILTNLLTNAAKFSPSESTVYVAVRKEDDELVVSVRDQGVGISDDDLPRLFQRFSRLKNPEAQGVPGTGLGLYITKALVEGQGGRIWLESTPGRGTTFTYTIPMAR